MCVLVFGCCMSAGRDGAGWCTSVGGSGGRVGVGRWACACVRCAGGRGGGGYVSVGGGSTVEVIERTELRIPFVLSHKESAGKV